MIGPTEDADTAADPEPHCELQYVRRLKTDFPLPPNESYRTLAQTVCPGEQRIGVRKIHKSALNLRRVTVASANRQGRRRRCHGIPQCLARSTGSGVHRQGTQGSDDLVPSCSPNASQWKPYRPSLKCGRSETG